MKFDAIRVQKEIEHYRSETAYRFAFKATERFSTALLAKSNSSDGNWWIQLSPCETVNFFRKALQRLEFHTKRHECNNVFPTVYNKTA